MKCLVAVACKQADILYMQGLNFGKAPRGRLPAAVHKMLLSQWVLCVHVHLGLFGGRFSSQVTESLRVKPTEN